MTVNFPVSLTDFFCAVGLVETTIYPMDPRTSSSTRGAEEITAVLSSYRWRGSASIRLNDIRSDRQASARAHVLMQPGATFLVTDHRILGPAGDTKGAVVSATTPQISAVNSNNVQIDVSGLPSDYVLTYGDMFSFEYGSGKYSLHEVIGDYTATGGVISDMDIWPRLEPGVTVGTALTFVRPFCKAFILPGSFSPSVNRGSNASGYSFEWAQSKR